MSFEINFIEKATSGKIISNPHSSFSSYCTDNRDKNIKGKIFIPLVGDNHDAHQYVAQAVEAGATGVIFHSWNEAWQPLKEKASFVEVDDTLKALQDFAKAWRNELSAKVIALTGSNGKTTTKDFLSQILSHFGETQASVGSFNNHWGVPFTLLNTTRDHKFCVVEMGMNHSGEITKLVEIANPEFVTVTNVGRAHMGHFKDGVDGVALAKEEIYSSAPLKTHLIFNVDDDWTRKMYSKYMDRRAYTFSNKNFSTDVYLKIKSKTETGYEVEGQIGGVLGKAKVSFWGEHNLQNLAAAVSLAYVAGCKPEKIWPLLESCHTGWGRNQWLKTKASGDILFDGYNANPDSFSELLKNVEPLLNSNNKSVAVFGEMLELGEQSSAEHKKLGELAGRLPWRECLFIGPSGADFKAGWDLSKNQKKPIILSSYKETLDLDLHSMVDTQSLIIVKGSRGSALERIVSRFEPVNFPPK